MTATVDQQGYICVGSLAALQEAGSKVVSSGEYPVLLLIDGESIRAVDNRCPHMGYPLSKGSACDGILTCHWHHWRFELSSGGCVTGGPNDLPTFPVEVRGDEIWIKQNPNGSGHAERIERLNEVLREGLEQNGSFTIAKAVVELDGAGVKLHELVQTGLLHAVRFRQQGFGPGATILVALARLLPYLSEEQRVLAVTHGLIHVARDTSGRAPRRPQRALPGEGPYSPAYLQRLFRTLIEEREPAGAERIVRTAIASEQSDSQVAAMLMAGLTDHFFLDTGHVLDFTNKALEATDLIGWHHAGELVTALSGPMANAFRHEEASSWSEALPLLRKAFADLPAVVRQGVGKRWSGEEELVQTMLESSEPTPVVEGINAAIVAGASPLQLSTVLGRAAVHRVARYPSANEEDWDAVLHVITYANAYDELVRRIGEQVPEAAAETLRGLYHGAIYVHLNRFLNVPRAKHPSQLRKPEQTDAKALRERLLWCGEFQQVDEAGVVVWAYLKAGHPVDALLGALAQVVLREDASFHTYQMLEAGIQWHHKLQGHEDANLALAAAARYVSAQRARRIILSNTTHAFKLRRGEAPEEAEG